MIKQIIGIVLLGIAFYSCTHQIDFEKEYLNIQLGLNSIITPDSLIKVELYTTMSINDAYPHNVYNAEVLLYRNNEFQESLELQYYLTRRDFNYDSYRYNYDTIYYYQTAKTIAEAGNEYKLKVNHPDYPILTCKTAIPSPVSITHIDTLFVCANIENDNYATFNFVCQIDDPEFTDNYYRIIVYASGRKKVFSTNNDGEIIESFKLFENDLTSIKSNDPVFRYETEDANNFLGSSYNTYGLFADALFNGDKKELKFNIRKSRYWSISYSGDALACSPLSEGEFFHFAIELHHLSRDTYLYFKSVDAQHSSEHLSFIEPVVIYSNIENGVGIFGSYSVSKYEVTFGES